MNIVTFFISFYFLFLFLINAFFKNHRQQKGVQKCKWTKNSHSLNQKQTNIKHMNSFICQKSFFLVEANMFMKKIV